MVPFSKPKEPSKSKVQAASAGNCDREYRIIMDNLGIPLAGWANLVLAALVGRT